MAEPPGRRLRPIGMRNIAEVDADLAVLAMIRRVCATKGRPLRSTTRADELLDVRLQLDDVSGPGQRPTPRL